MQKKILNPLAAHAADIVTLLRMTGAVVLLFLPPLGTAFFILYTLTGLTDALDGWLARKLGTASARGAVLDSLADLLFCGVVLLRLVPYLWYSLPARVWYAAAGVLLLRLAAYFTAAVKFHCFAGVHTILNKLTGGAVFLLPYFLPFSWAAGYCLAVCALGAMAAGEELAIHLFGKSCRRDVLSFFWRDR